MFTVTSLMRHISVALLCNRLVPLTVKQATQPAARPRLAGALSRDKKLTVVTNAPAIATALSDHPSCAVIVLGGIYDRAKGACLGAQAMREASQIFADNFHSRPCGVDTTAGVTALDAGEAEIKRMMVEQSSLLLIAATSDKLGTVAPFKIANASRIDHLIIEDDAGDTTAFEQADVQVHVAHSGQL
jgi:DeoR/GlpR family transcriptional regulator of sugar metabolism